MNAKQVNCQKLADKKEQNPLAGRLQSRCSGVTLKKKTRLSEEPPAGVWEKAHCREMPREGSIVPKFSHLKVSATNVADSTEGLQLLGLSTQLDLLQNKPWPETWLSRETASGCGLACSLSWGQCWANKIRRKDASWKKPGYIWQRR